MDLAPARYTIRIQGHLGPNVLFAFRDLVPQCHGPDTVLTGSLRANRALAQPPSGETFTISYLSSSDSKISKPSGGRGLARLAAACAARSSSVSQRS